MHSTVTRRGSLDGRYCGTSESPPGARVPSYETSQERALLKIPNRLSIKLYPYFLKQWGTTVSEQTSNLRQYFGKSPTEILADPDIRFEVIITEGFMAVWDIIDKADVGSVLVFRWLYDSFPRDFPQLPRNIGRLTQLKVLDISESKLSDLPVEISNLKQLEELNISNSQFKILPDVVFSLTTLIKLNISFNQLETLSSKIGNFRLLRELDLRNNPFKELPREIRYLLNLEIKGLTDNEINQLLPERGELWWIFKIKHYLAF